MREFAKKLIFRSKLCLALFLAFLLGGIGAIFLFGKIQDGLFMLLYMGTFSGMFASIIVYVARYHQFCVSYKSLEKEKLEDYLEGIDLSSPTLETAKIYCGKHACYSKRPHVIIPYDQVAWIHTDANNPGYEMFCLKNGRKYSIKIQKEKRDYLAHKYIMPQNPDLVIGNTEMHKLQFYKCNPQARSKQKNKMLYGGFVLLGIGILLLLAGLLNQTLNIGSGILVLLILLIGTSLIFWGKYYLRWKAFTNNLVEKIRKSPTVNWICKIGTLGYGILIVGMLVFAYFEQDTLGTICIFALPVFAIPFFLSIFLKCGFVRQNIKKCQKCFRPISGYQFKRDGKVYCKSCYNRQITLEQQRGGNIPEYCDFELLVEDVRLSPDHRVILTGSIQEGMVSVGDTVKVKNHTYQVRQIDSEQGQQKTYAMRGARVGLHLSEENPKLFQQGDVVTAKRFVDRKAKDSFVCDICKFEHPNKYRAKNSVCVECAKFLFVTDPLAALLDDLSFIRDMKHTQSGPWHQYDVLIAARGYGWEMMLEHADYMKVADLENISEVVVGSIADSKTDLTEKYHQNGDKLSGLADAEQERGMLSVAGISKTLRMPVKIVWINQTNTLRFFTPVGGAALMRHYAETVIRRTFGTDLAMRCGRLPHPVFVKDTNIYIRSEDYAEWRIQNPDKALFEYNGICLLDRKEPILTLFDDGVKTREYCLQTEGDEDFTGKWFHICVRLNMTGKPPVMTMQMDGFITDTPEKREFSVRDVGYRMEGYFARSGGEQAKLRYEMLRGQDLPMKGLKYPGYTTPTNIRLIGICPDCGQSFACHGYAYYMMQYDVAYSDDGLDCCSISQYHIDPKTWTYETAGKTFRYYNSFNCPHCGMPYIDYKKYPENKTFGVSGCVHLGRTGYQAE